MSDGIEYRDLPGGCPSVDGLSAASLFPVGWHGGDGALATTPNGTFLRDENGRWSPVDELPITFSCQVRAGQIESFTPHTEATPDMLRDAWMRDTSDETYEEWLATRTVPYVAAGSVVAHNCVAWAPEYG